MTTTRLDLLLNDWAARHTLRPERAEAIRSAVLAAPQFTTVPLPGEWWSDFSVNLISSLRQSTYLAPSIWYPTIR